MAIKKYENHPARKAFEEYGHEKKWEDMIAVKASTTYIAILFKGLVTEEFYYYVDLAFDGTEWQMQNDCAWRENDKGLNILSPSLFKSARIPDQCDWLEFPGTRNWR